MVSMRVRTIEWVLCSALVHACTPAPGPALVPVESTAAREEPEQPTTIVASTPGEYAFVDPSPPDGWQQCAGFVNTERDDVGPDVFDDCVGASRLRVRVWTSDNALEEDVALLDIPPDEPWPHRSYLQGRTVIATKTHWGGLDGGAPSVFMTSTDGTDACAQSVAEDGPTLGSGHAETAIIAPNATPAAEYRRSCGKEPLLHRKIALYR